VSGSPTFLQFNSLIDGNYTKTINGGALNLLFTGSGATSTSSPTENFFRLFGDMDGNRDVDVTNLADFPFFRDAIVNPGSLYRRFLDFNNNGDFASTAPGSNRAEFLRRDGFAQV